MVFKNAETCFKVGQIICVLPPDRIARYGFEARIDKINAESCTYTVLDESKQYTVKELVLLRGEN